MISGPEFGTTGQVLFRNLPILRPHYCPTMKKINFSKDVLPHTIAIGLFLLVTIFFFNPIFFDNKVLDQSDITQWEGSSKAMRDFRTQTGEEPLWTPSMFSGMPGYLVNVHWGNSAVDILKGILSFKLPHPICNIYLAFVCYYIMLLAFGIRSYLAIAGALAFGLSTYLIIGLSVGHNSRIGAIAFMPLVVAGVHLVFSDKKILGFGVTTAGLALHFRENHVQMTYYLLMILVGYGIMQLIVFTREKRTKEYFISDRMVNSCRTYCSWHFYRAYVVCSGIQHILSG